MKKISCFPLLFLLVSCNSFNEESFKKEVEKKLPPSSLKEKMTYKVSPEGEVSFFDKANQKRNIGLFYEKDNDFTLPKGTFDEKSNYCDIGISYFLYAPTVINKDVFLNGTNCAYNTLKDQICYYADHVTNLQFEEKEDGFSFFVKGVSRPLTIYNLYESEELADPESVMVTAKFNITLDYGKDGYLKKETIQTIDYQSKKDYVDLSCEYQYL